MKFKKILATLGFTAFTVPTIFSVVACDSIETDKEKIDLSKELKRGQVTKIVRDKNIKVAISDLIFNQAIAPKLNELLKQKDKDAIEITSNNKREEFNLFFSFESLKIDEDLNGLYKYNLYSSGIDDGVEYISEQFTGSYMGYFSVSFSEK